MTQYDALILHRSGNLMNLRLRQTIALVHHIVGLAHRIDDFGNIKNSLCTASLDNLHNGSSPLLRILYVRLNGLRRYIPENPPHFPAVSLSYHMISFCSSGKIPLPQYVAFWVKKIKPG
jgi:hypothetical protein